MPSTTLSRRTFLTNGALAGGGLLLTFGCMAAHRARGIDGELAAGIPNGVPDGAAEFGARLWITPDGVIGFQCEKVEMGQGTMSSLTAILAEELRVAPEHITVHFAPADRAYVSPDLGLQMTGGSSSVRTMYGPLRDAGAAARETLRAAAAARWKIPVDECRAEGGKVHAAGKTLTYGELATAAAQLPLAKPVLTAASEFKVIGKERNRLDGRAKATGKATYGIDVRVPHALVAVVLRAPWQGAELESYDAAPALKSPGVKYVIPISSGLAVVAGTYFEALKGREAAKATWKGGHKTLATKTQLERYAKLAASGEGKVVRQDGDVAKVAGGKKVTGVYTTPYLAHAPMEPQNCTAHVTDDRVTIWAPTQSPGLAQQMAREVTGYAYDAIDVHTTFLGGAFGRRLAQDYVREAVEVAKEVKQPVRVQWSREDDMQQSPYRPLTYHELEGSVGEGGRIASWKHVIVGQSILSEQVIGWLPAVLPEWVPDFAKNGPRGVGQAVMHWLGNDDTSTEGARQHPYATPHCEVRFHMVEHGLPAGFWRSVGHSFNGFVVESFVDELAHLAGQDPLAFRLAHLSHDGSEARVLAAAAKAAGWDEPPPAGTFRGIARHACFGSHVAQVAEVTKKSEGGWRVTRVVAAIDCGTVIDPDQVRAQVEGAIVFGMSAALYGAVTVQDGAVQQSNFHDYQVVRMDECPEIEVVLVPSGGSPQGVGEPGLPPIAPAIANAMFKATGVRQRTLPLKLTST